MAFYCCICGKRITGRVCVPNTTRRNKRGRIAWGRDCACAKCSKRIDEIERKTKDLARLILKEKV